jgi:hypothetical protein
MDDKWVYRKAIIATAYAEVLAGSHYLNGTDGGHPTENGAPANGLRERKIALIQHRDKHSIAVDTAKYSDRFCQGRYAECGGYELDIGNKDSLDYFIDQCCPPSQWGFGLTPRSVNWTKVIVGESCRGKRHFDCIFFVNWVLTRALMRPAIFSLSINQWANPEVAPVTVLKKDKLAVGSLRDGDIFLKTSGQQHIGFLTSGGNVIHASSMSRGVVMDAMKLDKYDHVVRLKDSVLKFG